MVVISGFTHAMIVTGTIEAGYSMYLCSYLKRKNKNKILEYLKIQINNKKHSY